MQARLARIPSVGVMVLLGAFAGCGSSSSLEEASCDPPCPSGFSCQKSGCEPLGPTRPDLPMTLGDAGCACGGDTPYCDDQGGCARCLVDAHCPAGQVCRALGASAACLPGCGDDARCRGQGGADSLRCCGGACVDTASDVVNCGACGMPCAPPHAGAACQAGQCAAGACLPGFGDCNRDPADGCEVDLRTDTANCAACGARCAFSHAVAGCGDGCFIAACDFGYDDCDAVDANGCEVSVLADPRNCGACGNGCPGAPHARMGCANAQCVLASCDKGFNDCDGNAVNGCESAAATDARNCGGCGIACAQGLVCVNGGCTCPNCSFPNARSACINNICTLVACLPGFADCNNVQKDGCEVNTGNSTRNCGACGNACPMGLPVCFGGQCVKGCAYQTTVLADSPIGYWPLDDLVGPAVDKGSGAHNGTLFGAPMLGVDGVSGTAYLFHGNNDHLRVGPVTSGTGAEITYEAWLYLTALPNAPITIFWDDDSQGGGDSWVEITAQGNFQSRRSPDGFVDFTSQGTLSVNAWHHLVFVFDANGKAYYLDGALDSTTNVRINSRTGRSYFTIAANYDGNSFPGGAQYFAGTLDEVAVYDHALSAQQVSDHYNAGCGK